ncbi:hypothetical protein Pelo_15948 [Pelomyxa schiedti]|nr:hypothetical protein Pelo_15948 [Pelomyxa schiedti]
MSTHQQHQPPTVEPHTTTGIASPIVVNLRTKVVLDKAAGSVTSTSTSVSLSLSSSSTAAPSDDDYDNDESNDPRTKGAPQRARGRERRRKRGRPIVLRVLLSISFIVLVIALLAAVVPTNIIWVMSSRGIQKLQDESLESTISARCLSIEATMVTHIENFEQEMGSSMAFVNRMIAKRMLAEAGDPAPASVPLGVAYNETVRLTTMLEVYGGIMDSFGVFVDEGMYIVAPRSVVGAVQMFQYGFDSNCSTVLYPYLIDDYEPNWDVPLNVPIIPLGRHSELSDEQWDTLASTSSLMWTSVGARKTEIISAELCAPLFLPGSANKLAGFVSGAIAASHFISLLPQDNEDGIICTFVQNFNGMILSSTCEVASYMNETEVISVNTLNSTIWEVRDSASHLATALAGNISEVFIFHGRNYTVAFLQIKSSGGFTAVTTVIAGTFSHSLKTDSHTIPPLPPDTDYFQQTYSEIQNMTEHYITLSILLALVLAGTLSVCTLGGQLQIIHRIKKISDISVGANDSHRHKFGGSKVHPGELPEEEPKMSLSERVGGWLKKINAFTRLTEVQLILQKLEWLEGKVRIVVAFVPVVSKLVCKQQFSDLAILESSLARRMGCYLFCDIENFTPLCESVSPDIAAKLLELFYDTVERAAKARKHNLLVKRLGDGIFLTWGFQLEVEKKKSSSTPFPALAYAAALRIAESVVELSRKAEALVGSEAPDWHCTLRIGVTTGPALHGLLKTDTLINPDVVGAAVNLAARCQTVGKLANIKELSRLELSTSPPPSTPPSTAEGGAGSEGDCNDRVVCTITSDMATHQANTHLADQLTSSSATGNNTTPIQMVHASKIASQSVEAYTRYLVEDVPLQGIGKTNLSVTFVTRNKATHRLIQPREKLQS